MDIKNLPLSEDVKYIIREVDGIKSLYPPQEEAITKGLLKGENLVVAIPTASGKTLLAEMVALKHVLELGGKVIYLCPLRALATEKFIDFKRFESLGVKCAITSGDYDSTDHWLKNYDIIVSTNEKIDALLRHRARWILEDVTLVIIDECHLIDDRHRGPTLETLLAQLMIENSNIQFLALSATIGNPENIAEWLNATLIYSTWRPVTLKMGVYLDNYIIYPDATKREIKKIRKNPVENIVVNSVIAEEQILVFSNTRNRAVSTAEKLGKIIKKYIAPEDLKLLKKLSEEIQTEYSDPLSDKLALTIANGVTFHHAGLTSEQRQLVEGYFKNGLIKVITATPTLAAGINLPAKRVVIQSVYRYTAEEGNVPIKTLEVHQMCGRAGRPQFDREGEAILIAKNPREVQWLMSRYILKKPEPIFSKLAAEPALRKAILGLVSSKTVENFQELIEFFEHTFYGFQFEAVLLEDKIRSVIELLANFDMIDYSMTDGQLLVTPYGKKVSELYLDPLSADILVKGMEKAVTLNESDIHPFALLDLVVSTPDVTPLYLRKKQVETAIRTLNHYKDVLLREAIPEWDIEFEYLTIEIHTASLVYDWINEIPIENIITKYNIGAGDVRRIKETVEWLVSSMRKIAALKEKNNPSYSKIIKKTTILEQRVIHGIKEDAIELVTIKGIGRKRARILLNKGVRDVNTLRNLTIEELSSFPLFGKELAKIILERAKNPHKEPLEENYNLPINEPVIQRERTVPTKRTRIKKIDDYF